MEITTENIKKLREMTSVSVMQCKKALLEAGGDLEKAKVILKKHSAASAQKKAERSLKAGVIGSYIHDGTIGALVLLSSETDFVAKNPEFGTLARELAMQVAAMDPEKTEDLLEQSFIKDESKTVRDLLNEATQKFGERVEVSNFTRLSARTSS
jgi:elongation factor Ts